MTRRAMLRFIRHTALATAVAIALPAMAAEDLPKDAKPLTAFELLKLYGGTTWQWGAGGGYFDTEGRVFRARTGSEGDETTAIGTWHIRDDGTLCFKAVWSNAEGRFPAKTCFWHVQAGGDIYQRTGKGKWYVFRHAKPQPTDEFNKLVSKDLVGLVQQ